MTRACAGLFIALLAGLAFASVAQAQTPTPSATPAPPGSVTGTITNGTQGMTSVDGARVQLLALTSDGNVTSQDGTVEDGKFTFTPPTDSTVTYVLRVTYQDVPYLIDPPILLSPDLPDDHRDITVYETTTEAPDLRIDSTVVSLQGLDRAQGQLTLQREDQVVNPGDRVYVGGDDRVSLRMPTLEDVIQLVDTQNVDGGEAKLDGGTVSTTQPLKPGTNLVVTRYLVGYDQSADSYRVRVTAPLPDAHMEIWVPDRFVDTLQPENGAVRAADQDLQGEHWYIVQGTAAAAEGDSLVATIEGLSGGSATNPLTQRPAAAIGAVGALAALVAGVFLLGRVHLRWGGEASS
jgi:hypothetical protein